MHFYIKITLQHGCCLVNLLHFSAHFFVKTPLGNAFAFIATPKISFLVNFTSKIYEKHLRNSDILHKEATQLPAFLFEMSLFHRFLHTFYQCKCSIRFPCNRNLTEIWDKNLLISEDCCPYFQNLLAGSAYDMKMTYTFRLGCKSTGALYFQLHIC